MEHLNEIILYHPDETIKIDVRVDEETVWLTQQQMAQLFETTRNNVTLHIKNIFKEGELLMDSVCKDSLLTATDGKRYRTVLYNLDVIISVGYRVKSLCGSTGFCTFAQPSTASTSSATLPWPEPVEGQILTKTWKTAMRTNFRTRNRQT